MVSTFFDRLILLVVSFTIVLLVKDFVDYLQLKTLTDLPIDLLQGRARLIFVVSISLVPFL